MKKNKYGNIEILKSVVASSISVAEVARKLGYKDSGGGAVAHLKKVILAHQLDTSHFKGQGWSIGKTALSNNSVAKMSRHKHRKWSDLFKKGSIVHNYTLLRRLIFEKKRDYACNRCGISNWNGKPLRLHLEHINGDNTDNREENLEVLCPNCHSQTDTFCRGIKKCGPNHTTKWWKELSCASVAK